MPEGEDLCLKFRPCQETLPDRMEQRGNDREHSILKLSLPPFKFNWLNENGVFGRHYIKTPRRIVTDAMKQLESTIACATLVQQASVN